MFLMYILVFSLSKQKERLSLPDLTPHSQCAPTGGGEELGQCRSNNGRRFLFTETKKSSLTRVLLTERPSAHPTHTHKRIFYKVRTKATLST